MKSDSYQTVNTGTESCVNRERQIWWKYDEMSNLCETLMGPPTGDSKNVI